MIDRRSTLHWGALLVAGLTTVWAVLSFRDELVLIMPLLGVAGFVLLLVAARHQGPDVRPLMQTGAGIGLVAYAGWTLLRLTSLPVAVRIGGTNTSSEPPAALGTFADGFGTWLPTFAAIAVVLCFWPLWRTTERILGLAGGLIVLLLHLLSPLDLGSGTTLGLVLRALFTLAFLALTAALLVPLFTDGTRHPHWHGEGA